MRQRKSFFLLLLALSAVACWRLDETPWQSFTRTARERYASHLEKKGLAGPELVKQWQAAGKRALQDSIIVNFPYRETGAFTADEPAAHGYRIEVAPGEIVYIRLTRTGGTAAVFGDLFRLAYRRDWTEYTRPLKSWDTADYTLEHEVKEAGSFLLRIQPELLVNCTYELEIDRRPALVFPVAGKGNSAIQSFWGAPRDGGRRSHEGVDIFAPTGRPVVAVCDGFIRESGYSGLGGKIVWLSDPQRRLEAYYAHLDEQYVSTGDYVQAGDTLGTVGKTGNAKRTPPHLHFGIYRWSGHAIDPLPFIKIAEEEAPLLQADTSLLGQWVEVRKARTLLRPAADNNLEEATPLEQFSKLRVEAVTADQLRVRLPDGRVGYLHPKEIRPTGNAPNPLVLNSDPAVRWLSGNNF